MGHACQWVIFFPLSHLHLFGKAAVAGGGGADVQQRQHRSPAAAVVFQQAAVVQWRGGQWRRRTDMASIENLWGGLQLSTI